jgi:hypothetical protein
VLAAALAGAALAGAELAPLAAGAPARASQLAPLTRQNAGATLLECVTAVTQAERAATFAGEMTAIAGATRMEMRVDLLERMPGETSFHLVSAPALGVWRAAAPGVKVFKYLKQVTNLAAPAFYRGAVRFRWLNAQRRLVKAGELRTPRCEQPAGPAPVAEPSPTSLPSTPAP